jgi:hypothetical protein
MSIGSIGSAVIIRDTLLVVNEYLGFSTKKNLSQIDSQVHNENRELLLEEQLQLKLISIFKDEDLEIYRSNIGDKLYNKYKNMIYYMNHHEKNLWEVVGCRRYVSYKGEPCENLYEFESIIKNNKIYQNIIRKYFDRFDIALTFRKGDIIKNIISKVGAKGYINFKLILLLYGHSTFGTTINCPKSIHDEETLYCWKHYIKVLEKDLFVSDLLYYKFNLFGLEKIY